MSLESFASVGPGKILARLRNDLRTATKSVFLIGPWIDDYVAEQIVLVANRDLAVRVLVRSKQQVEGEVWQRIANALSTFSAHWPSFEARTLDRLHARCLLIDDRIAYVGSANWYRYSLEQSLEIVVRGPVAAVPGLQDDCQLLWDDAIPLANTTGRRTATDGPAVGITHEILDPLAAQVLKDNPKAFVMGKKNRRQA